MKVGKLLGADYLIIVAVNEWTPKKSGFGVAGIGQVTAEVALSFRVINAASGELTFSGTERATAESVNFVVGGKQAPINYSLQSCLNKGAYRLATSLKPQPWRGSVADIKGNKMYINAGSNRGIETGMKLTALSKGEAVIDPGDAPGAGQRYGGDRYLDGDHRQRDLLDRRHLPGLQGAEEGRPGGDRRREVLTSGPGRPWPRRRLLASGAAILRGLPRCVSFGSSTKSRPAARSVGWKGRRGAVLSTDHVLPGHPPITLLRCPACGAAFLQDLTPPDYESDMAEMLDYYVEQGAGIDLIVAPLLRLPPQTVRRCLEIGGSFGFALDFSRYAFGWEVLGVDPSPLAAAGAEALGLPVRRCYFSADLDLGPEPFELAICSEVLEHIAEPHALLAAIRDRLSPDGILVLSTPNLALVRPETGQGALGRALSPGLHVVLYDRRALVRILEGAGFAAVRVDESPETLRAFASRSPVALERLRPADPSAERALLRRYFADRAASAPPASALACGFAYRHFKECVNAGLYEEAAASRVRLARIYRERFGLDLETPDLEAGRTLPFNLTGALFFSGILELNSLGRPDRAAGCFAAAVAAGTLLQGDQNPFGLCDGETEALVAQSRKHLPMALAATEPERAVREIEALELAMPGRGVSPALLAEARAQTFIRLVNAGAYTEAERLAPRLAPGIAAGLEDGGEINTEALDSLYCLGMLALHRERPDEAAELFGRVHQLAGERTEIFESARLHEEMARAHLAAGQD